MTELLGELNELPIIGKAILAVLIFATLSAATWLAKRLTERSVKRDMLGVRPLSALHRCYHFPR